MPGSGWLNTVVPNIAGQPGGLEYHKSITETFPRTAFEIFDDFTDTAAHSTKAMLVTTETGSGTNHAIFVPASTAIQGESTGIAGRTTANAEELAGKVVGWKTSTMGPLYMEARVKWTGATTAADGDCFIGWSDVITATSGLAYDVSLTSTNTSTGVTEGAMIGYSSIPTSGALHPTTGNNYYGVFTTISTVAPAPKASTTLTKKDSNYHVFRTIIDVLGNATFYLDGNQIGYTALAVTPGTALTPYIGAITRNSHENTCVVDYIKAVATTRV